MKIMAVVEQVAYGMATVAAATVFGWLTFHWIDARDALGTALAVAQAQKQTIALKNDTISAYEKAANTSLQSANVWRDRYEQLRWQTRTKKGVD